MVPADGSTVIGVRRWGNGENVVEIERARVGEVECFSH